MRKSEGEKISRKGHFTAPAGECVAHARGVTVKDDTHK